MAGRYDHIAVLLLTSLLAATGCTDPGRGRDTDEESAVGVAELPFAEHLVVTEFDSEKLREAYEHFYPPHLRASDNTITEDDKAVWKREDGLMRIESNHIGPGGSWSPRAVAFCTILDSPRADELFKSLLNNSDVPLGSRLYALCGVYWTDREAFHKGLVLFRDRDDELEWRNGCMIMPTTVRSVMRDIESGRLPQVLLKFSSTRKYKDTYLKWQTGNVPRKLHDWSPW